MANIFDPAQGGTPKAGWGAYGGIPQLPPYTTDTTTFQGADYFGQLAGLAPGVLGNLQSGVGAIGNMIGGRVQPSTLADIGSYAAQIGSGGMGMGPNAPGVNTSALKLLGLTAEDLTKQGLLAQNQLFSAFPYTQGGTTTTKTDLSALQSIFNAMPDPYQAAMESLRAIGSGMGRGRGGGGGFDPIAWMAAQQLGLAPKTTGARTPAQFTPSAATPGWGSQGAYVDEFGNIIYPGLGEKAATWEEFMGSGGLTETGGTQGAYVDEFGNIIYPGLGETTPTWEEMFGTTDTSGGGEVGSLLGGVFGGWYDENQ